MSTVRREATIHNRLGLHARAAARFVTVASAYEAEVHVEYRGKRVNGKSIMGLMMLAAGNKAQITLEADGDDAEALLDALEELVSSGFGEGVEA